MLSVNTLYSGELADGSLEQMLRAPASAVAVALAKAAGHWLVAGLPLIVASPVIGLLFDMSTPALSTLVIGLLLGTPILSLLGAVAAALATGLRGGALLLSLMVLPLSVPVLVFGCGAVDAVLSGQSPAGALSLVGAGLLLALAGAPAACAAALRISVEA